MADDRHCRFAVAYWLQDIEDLKIDRMTRIELLETALMLHSEPY